jgi:hypothetical protein
MALQDSEWKQVFPFCSIHLRRVKQQVIDAALRKTRLRSTASYLGLPRHASRRARPRAEPPALSRVWDKILRWEAALGDVAAWLALGATCIAAIMTASNLGPRVTGWGFVIFTAGAAAWIVVGIVTDQPQLLWSNVILAFVDVFGIWRWLGRQAKFADVAEDAESQSEGRPGPDLIALSHLLGSPVRSADGSIAAHLVEAMARCDDGAIDYVIVREGGVGGLGESLRRIGWQDIEPSDDELVCGFSAAQFSALPTAEPPRQRNRR